MKRSPDRLIVINKDLVITERKTRDNANGIVYEYYIGSMFVFGVVTPFTAYELTNLYNTGYFNFWLYELATKKEA